MFGNLFSGMFGKKSPAIDLSQGADALGQAAAGAPMAMGSGPAGKGVNPQMLSMILRGFGSGANPFASSQQMQIRNVYQPMSPAQKPVMFSPYGGR